MALRTRRQSERESDNGANQAPNARTRSRHSEFRPVGTGPNRRIPNDLELQTQIQQHPSILHRVHVLGMEIFRYWLTLKWTLTDPNPSLHTRAILLRERDGNFATKPTILGSSTLPSSTLKVCRTSL